MLDLQLSQVVIPKLSYMSSKLPIQPDFFIKCNKVSFWSHLFNGGTYGKYVAWYFEFLWVPDIMVPCLPMIQSQRYCLCQKLKRRETPTLNYFTYQIVIGPNLSSSDEIRANCPRISDSFPAPKVPIQPLNFPFFSQVTNIGNSSSISPYGYFGRGLSQSLAIRVSKQYLQ